jgi:hypothetical protein
MASRVLLTNKFFIPRASSMSSHRDLNGTWHSHSQGLSCFSSNFTRHRAVTKNRGIALAIGGDESAGWLMRIAVHGNRSVCCVDFGSKAGGVAL